MQSLVMLLVDLHSDTTQGYAHVEIFVDRVGKPLEANHYSTLVCPYSMGYCILVHDCKGQYKVKYTMLGSS